MPTLLTICDEMAALDALLEENGGDVSDPVVDACIREWESDIKSNLDAKCDGYASLIREWELRCEAKRAEEVRLQKSRQSLERQVETLKLRLLSAFRDMGIKKAGKVRTVSLCNNGGQLPLEMESGIGPEDLPPSFQRVTVDFNFAAIREALDKDGTAVPFAKYGERGQHISIR